MLASITYRKNKLSATLGAGASQFNNRHFGEAIATEFTGYEDLNAIYYDNDASKRDMNVYAKLKYQWRNWFPYVDIQARSINYQFEGLDNNLEFGNQEVDYLFFNPKVGLTYVLNNHSFYGMYAIGNREPVRDDFRNNKTDEWPEHEQLNNIEIGYRLQQGRKILNVNLYDMQYVNQLVLTGDVNDVGEAIRTNVDNSYRRGVEVEVQYPLSKRVQIGGNLTASQNKIESFTEHIGEWDDDFEVFTFEHKDKDISFSPNLISALVLSYQVNKHFSIDFFEKYVSKQYLDNTQSEERMLEAFWNLDASIKYTTTKIDGINALNIGLYINNALNAFYAPNGYTYGGYIGGERASFNYLYPMAGRNVMLKISAKL
jgi:iron complex outermembrane receptor protein